MRSRYSVLMMSMVIMIGVFFFNSVTALAADEETFAAKIREIAEETILVDVTDSLKSDTIKVGQTLSIRISAGTEFVNKANQQGPRLQHGDLAEIKIAKGRNNMVTAVSIKVLGR